jgi:aminodeoxyfutalosine synthase
LESPSDIVQHLGAIRSLQEETGGFKTFVPLPYHETHTQIKAKRRATTGYGDIRLLSTARIYLHNIPHIKALWMYFGEKMAQTLLCFGVDDLGGTYHFEKVVHAAGASTPDSGSETELRRLIEDAGMKPVRSAADYQVR